MGYTCPYTLSLLRHKAHVLYPIINDVLTLGTSTKEKRKKCVSQETRRRREIEMY
jgi:hypothetical protein